MIFHDESKATKRKAEKRKERKKKKEKKKSQLGNYHDNRKQKF